MITSTSLDNNAIGSTSTYDLAKMHHSRENERERERESLVSVQPISML